MMVDEPRCWPSDLVDEVMPKFRASPADWLPFLLGMESADDVGDTGPREPVADGEVVEFIFREIVGRGTVAIESGSATLSATCSDFEIIRDEDDGWTFANNVEDFAPEWLNNNETEGDGRISISVILEKWPTRKYRVVRGESGEFLLVEMCEPTIKASDPQESLNV